MIIRVISLRCKSSEAHDPPQKTSKWRGGHLDIVAGWDPEQAFNVHHVRQIGLWNQFNSAQMKTITGHGGTPCRDTRESGRNDTQLG